MLIDGAETNITFDNLSLTVELHRIQDSILITPNFGELIAQVDTIDEWSDLVYSKEAECQSIEEDCLGILNLEVVACQNLPKGNKILQSWRVLHPFAVVCFGRQTFRTRVVRNTLNPVWKEIAAL